MTGLQEKKGMILFCLIALILLAGAIMAFQVTGPQGIEERFSSATGISSGTHSEHEQESGGGDAAGPAIEGNLLLYGIFVGCLALGCVALYYHYRI